MTMAWTIFDGFMTAIHVVQRLPPHTHKGHREGGVCGGSVDCLALRELLALARLVEADLLAFDFSRIARHQARLRQRGLQLRVVIDQRASDSVANRAGLA